MMSIVNTTAVGICILWLTSFSWLSLAARVCPFGPQCHLPATPGCNVRPTCPAPVDPPCDDGTFFNDPCWPQVFYECTNGWPVPSVCPDPLIFNPHAGHGGACDHTGPGVSPHCGCDSSCAIPPSCPPTSKRNQSHVAGLDGNHVANSNCHEPCDGTRLLAHPCDCQFYWECDALGFAHLRACGPHSVFVARDPFSGTCVAIQNGISENVGCTLREAFILEKSKGPAPPPVRHPILDFFASLNLNDLLPHLRQYTKPYRHVV